MTFLAQNSVKIINQCNAPDNIRKISCLVLTSSIPCVVNTSSFLNPMVPWSFRFPEVHSAFPFLELPSPFPSSSCLRHSLPRGFFAISLLRNYFEIPKPWLLRHFHQQESGSDFCPCLVSAFVLFGKQGFQFVLQIFRFAIFFRCFKSIHGRTVILSELPHKV